MRENELRKHAECSNCHKKIGHTGLPMFWTMKVERHGLDANAIRRQDGLAMMLGGNSVLANVMGADEEMTVPLMDPIEITLCEHCAMGELCIMDLVFRE
jgi:hypothetical protein